MLTSIGKFTKSFFVKILVGIIILPFIFWGMGDIFRGGNQNIIVTIDSEKISTQEFINYLQRINLSEEERKSLANTNLLERILSEYTGRKIISLEVEKMGINVSDAALKNIIINDDAFKKNGEFSRTKYEKFLLESSLSAPMFEANLVEQEKKRQLLSFLSKGLVVSDYLVESIYKKENQIKEIKYIDLNEYYNKYIYKQEDIQKIFNENKDLFVEQFKSISFIELTPDSLIGKNEYDKNYFSKIDKIENEILDGKTISKIAEENSLKIIKTKEINFEKTDLAGNKINIIQDELFKKIFDKQNINEPELINLKDKYFLAEISTLNNKKRGIEDILVKEAIESKLKIQNILETNTNITKEISKKNYNLNSMIDFANKNNIKIKDHKIDNIAKDSIFSSGLIKRIYETKDNEITLLTNSKLSKNFIIFVKNTEYKNINKNSKEFKEYQTKAKLDIASKIYSTYDVGVNKKYKIVLNQKAIERIKNSF